MSDLIIKDVSEFFELDENNVEVKKTKLVIEQDGVVSEIIINGSCKLAESVCS